jgi:hypothetical protein
MSNGVYTIGQKPEGPPPMQFIIGIEGAHITLTLRTSATGGYDQKTAHLDAQNAAGAMQQIGVALEQLYPGHLIQGLETWLAELKAAKAEAKKVLSELGMAR